MRPTIFKRLSVLSLSLLLPLALACGGGETDDEMEATGGEEAAQPAAEPAAEPPTASIQPMGDAQVGGDVTFTRQGDSLAVAVSARNVPSAGAHASHIHEGTCSQPGGVVVPLNDVQAGDGGMGQATTTVGAAQLQAGSSYLVMVHGAEGAPIGCANVPSAALETAM